MQRHVMARDGTQRPCNGRAGELLRAHVLGLAGPAGVTDADAERSEAVLPRAVYAGGGPCAFAVPMPRGGAEHDGGDVESKTATE